MVEDEGFGLGGFFGDDFGYVDSAGLFGVDGGRYGKGKGLVAALVKDFVIGGGRRADVHKDIVFD